MYDKLYKLTSGVIASLGALCIISGLAMPNIIKFDNSHVEKLNVLQQHVANIKSNEIKLKNIEIEVNNNLSVDIKDYLDNPQDIEESVIRRLKLDTSNVNINTPGSYTYTITYNKKIYNGSVIIKPKQLPVVDSITLNTLSIELGKTLPNDISFYVKENLSDEIKNAIKLDISNINTNKAGVYLYSISYNGKFYTSTATVYEPQNISIEKRED